MTTTQYLVASLALSGVSFAIGLATGVWLVERRGTRREVGKRWIRRVTPYVPLVVAAMIGLHYIWFVGEEQELEECQSRYNLAVSKTLTIRSKLTARELANQTGLILAVGQMMREPEARTPAEERTQDAKFRGLFIKFAEEAEAINEERRANPLPELPDCT